MTETSPVIEHRVLEVPQPIDSADAQGNPSTTELLFTGGGYMRKSDGWTWHELSGLRIEGMRPGDQYQLQLVTLDEAGDEVTWSQVVHEQIATPGLQFASTVRLLHSEKGERVRWRILYHGVQTQVNLTRGDWHTIAYPPEPESR